MMKIGSVGHRISGMPARSWNSGFRAGKALLLASMPVFVAFLCGCAGTVSGKSAQPATQPPPPSTQTYSISGAITPSSGGSGATLTLSGAANATTTANSSGNYSFTGLSNGTYAVTPSNTGFTFTPTSQNATVNGANVSGVNFTAVAVQAHSVALTWNASTSTVAGYNVYRSTLNGSTYLRINSSLVAGLSYTDATVQSGTTYYYVTTAVDASGIESIFSNQASAAIP